MTLPAGGSPDSGSPAAPETRTAHRASRMPTSAEARAAGGDFLRRIWQKADQDQIFFMAGAIAFNVLVAIVPLALAAIGVAGFFLQARSDGTNPAEPVVTYLLSVLPPVGPEFREEMTLRFNDFVKEAGGLFTIGTLVFAWLATRLIGTLRSALREIFDIQQDRSILAGKLFDLQMVFVAGTLLAVNIFITLTLRLITDYGFSIFSLERINIQENLLQNMIFNAVAFLSIWFMFVLIYRYLPARRIQWRTALISATFTAVTFELLKQVFGWYFSTHANYTSTYGNLAAIAIVVIWVYYTAIAFILGGEVGQVASLRRVRRRQKERLS